MSKKIISEFKIRVMTNNAWTNDQKDMLVKLYPTIDNPRKLVDIIGKSYTAIKTKANLLKIKRDFHAVGIPSDTSFDQLIIDNYLTTPVKALGEQIGKSYTFITHRMKVLGLVVPKEIIEQRKQIGRIKPGDVPPNKGKKMPMEFRLKVEKSWFKRGHLPHNAKDKDGYISIRTDSKSGIKYKYIRLSLGKWVPLHRYTWEQHHGPVPYGSLVTFKNGDTLDCGIENLECITMEENMKRNTFLNYPSEIVEVVRLSAQLTKKINKKSKSLNNEK